MFGEISRDRVLKPYILDVHRSMLHYPVLMLDQSCNTKFTRLDQTVTAN